MNKLKLKKILFWSIFMGLAVFIVGGKGGDGYFKLIWAGFGLVVGALIGAFFSNK